MEFFVEGGILLGWCDENDAHHDDCKKFFMGQYNFSHHAYYISKKTAVDFQTLRRKRMKSNNSSTNYEETETCISYLLEKIELVDFSHMQEYVKLAHCLRNDVGCHHPDNEILSDALIWSLNSHNPFFITVDGCTIGNKRKEIIAAGERILQKRVLLVIKYVRERI